MKTATTAATTLTPLDLKLRMLKAMHTPANQKYSNPLFPLRTAMATHLLGKNREPVCLQPDTPTTDSIPSTTPDLLGYKKYKPCASGYVNVYVLSTGQTLRVRRDSLSAVNTKR